MKFISPLQNKTFTTSQLIKIAGVMVVLGTGIGIYTQIVVTPKIVEAYEEITGKFGNEVEYQAPIIQTTEDRVDVYFKEEYTKLEEEYDQKRKDEALLNAIERVEQEFEAQKESIRERELFL